MNKIFSILSLLMSLSEKRIVFITAGYPSKRFIYEHAKNILGCFIIIVDDPVDCWAKDIANLFIPIDNCLEILSQIEFDGICTFSEMALIKTSEIIDHLYKLGKYLRSPGYMEIKAVQNAKDKYKTREILGDVKHWIISDLKENIYQSLGINNSIKFPVVLKPTMGADSLGVKKVNNYEELQSALVEVSMSLDNLVVRNGALVRSTGISLPDGKCCGDSEFQLMIEEYLDGVEVDIDLVLSQDICCYSTVADNGPTKEPWFTETWAVMPSMLGQDVQEKLKMKAVESVKKLGFKEGIFHVEAKVRTDGDIRIIEVNARMGGGPIWNMHLSVYGFDMIKAQILLACGATIPAITNQIAKGGLALMTQSTECVGKYIGPSDFFAKYFGSDPRILEIAEHIKPGDVIPPGQPRWIFEPVVYDPKGPKEALDFVIEIAEKIEQEFRQFVIS
jgi:ATP-grasp domain